jgi:hypothetical protein
MARITLDLNQFKSSGIYTIEYDTSQSITLTTQTIRLVVGFSRVGPFNAPVYLQDTKTALQIYGPIDPFLERRGSYFHRALATCLKLGPVFGLALMPINNGQDPNFPTDNVDFRNFSIDIATANAPTSDYLYSAFFNKQKFWVPDSEAFTDVSNLTPINAGRLLGFVNLSQTPMSILVRKSSVTGFDITATNWYGVGNVPDYVRPFDYISDYFIDVIMVSGDWTNYAKLAIDPIFSQYFDQSGVIKNNLNAFLSSSYTTILGSFTGCILPDLVDGEGRNYFIETIINNNIATTGLLCSVNQDQLDDYINSVYKVDMVGHGLVNALLGGTQTSIDFLSYNLPIRTDYNFPAVSEFTTTTFTVEQFPNLTLNSTYLGGDNGIFNNVVVIDLTQADPTALATLQNDILVGSSVIVGTASGTPANCIVQSCVTSGTTLRISYSHPLKTAEPTQFSGVTPLSIVAPVGSTKGYITLPGNYTTGSSVLTAGDTVLFQKAGFRLYLTVFSVAYDSVTTHNTTVTFNELSFTGIDSTCTISAGCAVTIDLSAGLTFAFTPDKLILNSGVTPREYNAYQYSPLYEAIASGSVKIGDKIHVTEDEYLYVFATVDSENLPIYRVKVYQDPLLSTQIPAPAFGTTENSVGTASAGLNVISLAASINTDYPIISTNPTQTSIVVSAEVGQSIQVGNYLVSEIANQPGNYELTHVVSTQKFLNTATGVFQFTINTNEAIWINNGTVSMFAPIDDFANEYRFTLLNGFTLDAFHLPGTVDTEDAQLQKILGVLDPATSTIYSTLTSKEIIQFRYIVDTFDGGLNTGSVPKNILTQLAQARQKCMAIVNVPSIEKFIDSNDPLFTDAPDLSTGNVEPTLDTGYIVSGGNLTLGPSFLYTLPSVDDGSQYAGFFSPFLIARTNGKNTTVPPAAYVSNLFVKKFLNGTPYAIVAGTRRGVIDDPEIVGLEYEFLDSDRDNLEPFGINPIITRKKTGILVYGNQSAYQNITSALNSLHVRDLLITLEEGVEDILSNYVFEFNDASTRLQIKSIVETYLSNIQSDGGIYDFAVQMDSNNNTNAVIDANVGIIDITIEPAKGLQKIINRVTVTRTGGVSAGGFTSA